MGERYVSDRVTYWLSVIIVAAIGAVFAVGAVLAIVAMVRAVLL